MSSIGTGYDLSVTTFSPDGRVFQIEYAAKAVDNSGTVVGIKCKDGIVLGVEKLIASKMMLPGSNRRIHSVHRHSGMGHPGVLTWIALAFCILLVAVRAYLKSRAVVAAEVAAAEEQELPDVARHPPEP
ncbi:Proteasome subunit alpha type-3 [Capsicum annuum]|uniref:Proteasome subunit alpha type n=1 Tax=Capsicum annuum TaxID=4072 RepID=A0A2G2Y154_CAPAN|nr:Proteasome subunit alpha type-3 [Capsicum annuum]